MPTPFLQRIGVVSVALHPRPASWVPTVSGDVHRNLAKLPTPPSRHAPGLECCVFMPGDLELGKVLGTLILTTHLDGGEGQLMTRFNRLCSEWRTPTAGLREHSTCAPTTRRLEKLSATK